MLCSEVQLEFLDSSGESLAGISIYERSQGTLHQLDKTEAIERGEEPIQLVEGKSYEYRLTLQNFEHFRMRSSAVVQPSRLSQLLGRIEPGLNTGVLVIELEDESGELVSRLAVEVRTNKLGYHRDYRYMLESIASQSLDLLLDVQAPAQVRLQPSSAEQTPTLHQRVAFLRHLLTSSEFEQSLDVIASNPHRYMVSELARTPTHRGVRRSGAFAVALFRDPERLLLPPDHPVHESLKSAGVTAPSLPRTVTSSKRYESLDTPENRFVKFVLKELQQTLADVVEILEPRTDIDSVRLVGELSLLHRTLERRLCFPLFQQVGRAEILPLGSPVLQRRSGYREMLQTWLKFNLAAQLTWTGGDDVLTAGKKDVAVLYEYWCYFLLLDVISGVVVFDCPPIESLVDMSASRLHLRLRAGRSLDLVGTHRSNGKQWHVRYSYNRTFSGAVPSASGSYPRPGSWTRAMRPDFSISVWPLGMSEIDAEVAEQISHIHFDAKYRIDSYVGLFGTSTDVEDNDDPSQPSGRAKRNDLLKMHAYRDAIRRSVGAYVLYPGPDSGDVGWIEYHEIVPGLGAFSALPGKEDRTKEVLSTFIADVLESLSSSLHLSTPCN